MSVSFISLTYNCADVVARCVPHNLTHAGAPIDEFVWVDNGSTDHVKEVMSALRPDVTVLNKTNLGVSKGFNRAYAMTSCDYVVIVDSDVRLPDGWLRTFQEYQTAIPNTGVSCILYREFKAAHVLKHSRWSNGLCYVPQFPVECRFVSRKLLQAKIGYLREDFGLYGWEDVEWRRRATRICHQEGLLTYAIPGRRAEHLGPSCETPEFRAFKEDQENDPRKEQLVCQYEHLGFPYFNPYL